MTATAPRRRFQADDATLIRVRGALLTLDAPVVLPSYLLDDLALSLGEEEELTPRQIAEVTHRLKQVFRCLVVIGADGSPELAAALNRIGVEPVPPPESAAGQGYLRRLAICVLDMAEHAAVDQPARASPNPGPGRHRRSPPTAGPAAA